jgi:hypothetical protein
MIAHSRPFAAARAACPPSLAVATQPTKPSGLRIETPRPVLGPRAAAGSLALGRRSADLLQGFGPQQRHGHGPGGEVVDQADVGDAQPLGKHLFVQLQAGMGDLKGLR